jgi:hypothetical protein
LEALPAVGGANFDNPIFRAAENFMSALGQKPTFAMHQAMSALPPIATAKANSGQRSCPL